MTTSSPHPHPSPPADRLGRGKPWGFGGKAPKVSVPARLACWCHCPGVRNPGWRAGAGCCRGANRPLFYWRAWRDLVAPKTDNLFR